MISPSKNKQQMNKNTEQEIINQLDCSVDELSVNQLNDIAQARVAALTKLHARNVNPENNIKQSAISWSEILKSYIVERVSSIKLALPVAASLALVISLTYFQAESIPELPVAMMAAEIPLEDFAMLEDLAFVTWLAENETSIAL